MAPKKGFFGASTGFEPVNWPASSVWVFIAQLGEHCSANAEATGSNPVEAPKNFFSGYFRNCLNCDSLRWSHTHFICIPAVHIISFIEKVSLNFSSCNTFPYWASAAQHHCGQFQCTNIGIANTNRNGPLSVGFP